MLLHPTNDLLRKVLILISIFLVTSGYSYGGDNAPALTMPRMFSDHMVLQRKCIVNFWGRSSPGRQIKISASWGGSATAITNDLGAWKTKLSSPDAGGPYIIEIKNADTIIVLHDVLVGEVWLASGQSNMDIPVKGWPPGDTILNAEKEVANARYPGIRFMKVPFNTSAHPQEDVNSKWTPLSPENAGDYSAAAYFYARKLYQELHIPIGILQSSIGGTPVEAWTSKEALNRLGDFNRSLAQLDADAPDRLKINSNTPSVLFNAMINPLIPYTIKGIIWYQGESNVGRAQQYKRLFPAMIEDWRSHWGRDLPFYYVQLAPYLYKAADQKNRSQELRDAQRYALRLPKTGMVSTLDIGYLWTAHPPYKQEVGLRLARLALTKAYGRKMIASGPIYTAARPSGHNLIITFQSIGSGLRAGPKGLYNFEVAGADKIYSRANARIVNDQVVLSSASIDRPVWVRYAWSDSGSATLFNKEGLPAATFTSDTVPDGPAARDSLPSNAQQAAPKILPGKGLQEFDFFYAGEAKTRNMYIIRQGTITWSYIDTTGQGEISDAILMPNGNVLFAHQFGVTLIDHSKHILWNYDAPHGYEVHTAQPIGDDHVIFVQNGQPAKVLVMNIHSDKVVKEFVIPSRSGTHGQIRHARLTERGTLLVAHMDLGRVSEYDINGKELRSIEVPSVWSAVPLTNGNILVTSNQDFVREYTLSGKIVWDCSLKDLPGYSITNPQLAVRLPDGNTLINNWFNQWNTTLNVADPPVQAIIVTPDKKIVWALRSWSPPADLGPATTIQLLNRRSGPMKKVHFGNIK